MSATLSSPLWPRTQSSSAETDRCREMSIPVLFTADRARRQRGHLLQKPQTSHSAAQEGAGEVTFLQTVEREAALMLRAGVHETVFLA